MTKSLENFGKIASTCLICFMTFFGTKVVFASTSLNARVFVSVPNQKDVNIVAPNVSFSNVTSHALETCAHPDGGSGSNGEPFVTDCYFTITYDKGSPFAVSYKGHTCNFNTASTTTQLGCAYNKYGNIFQLDYYSS